MSYLSRIVLLAAWTLCFLIAINGDARPLYGQQTSRPNVLMILVDDLKPALGCYGDKLAQSPNIDSLAAKGLSFERTYCNQAVCAPSRFTLMLGSHSTSSGLYGLGSQLRDRLPDAVTLPQYFAANGYRTESLGKVFHIGHGNYGDPQSFSVPHFGDKVVEYLEPASTQGGKLTREEALFTNRELGRIRELPRGAAFESPDVDDEAYADGRVARETIQRLRAAADRRAKESTPFFMVVGFARPHLPFSVPKKYWELYDPTRFELAAFHELPKNAPTVAGKRGGEIAAYSPVPENPNEPISDELARHLIHGYYAGVSYMDAQIGKVMNEVESLGLLDNTIIVFWSDHGYHLGDHGIWTKHTNYEETVRIPLIVYAPGISTAGSTTRQFAESVDLYPTLAELAGLPKPTGPQPIDGLSLASVIKSPEVRVRDHAYHVYPNAKLGRAIRTDRYRLVEWKRPVDPRESAEIELYDYGTDPLEKQNIAESHPDVVRQLRSILDRYPAPARLN